MFNSNQKLRLPLFSLFILALMVRLMAAWPQQQPNYMDAAYSYVNALNLAAGRGLVEDFIWNYLDNPSPPPHPSHLYWMPLTSILAWLGMAIGGVSYRAAQMPFVVLSALLAPISFLAAEALSHQRRHGWLAGMLAIFSGFYFPFWTAIDNFTPFAVTGSLALLAAWQGMKIHPHPVADATPLTPNPSPRGRGAGGEGYFLRRRLAWFFVAGIFTGLAHLARADGPLFLVTIILVRFTIYDLRFTICDDNPRSQAKWDLRFTRDDFRFIFFLLLGYFVVMTPWFIRNWLVSGALLSAAGSQTIWLANYDEIFSYGRELSAQTFLAQGFAPIWQGRWWALTANLQTVLAVWGMIFLAPLALIGAWRWRYHLLIQLAAGYALLLFLVMTLVFPFPGARGGLFHSGTAMLPFIYAAAVIGLDEIINWAAARRRGWRAAQARQVFGAGLLVLAIGLSGFIYYGRVLKNNAWNRADALYPAIAAWVAEQNPSAIVMIGNPPAYRYHGGGLSLVVPNENIETTLQAARRYHVDYLILDLNHPAPLAELYNQTVISPALSLVQTFTDEAGNKTFIFKLNLP